MYWFCVAVTMVAPPSPDAPIRKRSWARDNLLVQRGLVLMYCAFFTGIGSLDLETSGCTVIAWLATSKVPTGICLAFFLPRSFTLLSSTANLWLLCNSLILSQVREMSPSGSLWKVTFPSTSLTNLPCSVSHWQARAGSGEEFGAGLGRWGLCCDGPGSGQGRCQQQSADRRKGAQPEARSHWEHESFHHNHHVSSRNVIQVGTRNGAWVGRELSMAAV